jgi:hypothetical protein
MSARLFSILRRKPGLIDFITPRRPHSDGVAQYRLKTDTGPFGTFVPIVMTVGPNGMVDPDVQGPQHVAQPGNNVRCIFKPSNFGLSDTDAFWLKLVYVNGAGAEMGSPAPSAASLILLPPTVPFMTGFNATALPGNDISDSVQIDLPRGMENFRISNLENDPTIFLYVATQEGGPEFVVPAGEESVSFYGLVSSFWVRANKEALSAAFSTQFVYANPR